MFSLRERTRIRLCRTAFVLLCLAPTCLVLACAVAIRLPSYRRWHEAALADSLGVTTQLAAVSTPRPGSWRYEGLELRDPESDHVLARVPVMEINQRESALAVALTEPAAVDGDQLETLWRRVAERTRGPANERAVLIEAASLTVHLAGGDQKLVELSGRLETGVEHAHAELAFRPADSAGKQGPGATLTYTRERKSNPPAGTLRLSTGGAPLPCALAVPLWPELKSLGADSQFQGQVTLLQQGAHQSWSVAGDLQAVDLASLSAGHLSHPLAGTAHVRLVKLVAADGRIETAEGRLQAVDGHVGRGLLQSAITQLRLQWVPETMRSSRVGFSELDVAFSLGAAGLVLHGEAGRRSGVMLIDEERRPVLGDPEVTSQPVASLARALANAGDTQVPATRQTAWLLRALPLPVGGSARRDEAANARAEPETKTR